jgi:hypothetical protein
MCKFAKNHVESDSLFYRLKPIFQDSHLSGIPSSERFGIFPIVAIQKLWVSNFSDAQSLLIGYLLLKPKYDKLSNTIREENCKKEVYDQLLERFIEDNEEELKYIVENKVSLSSLRDIEKLNLPTLRTAFWMIPNKTNNNDHKTIVKAVISAFAEKLVLDDKIDYQIQHDFLQTYTYFVLNSPTGVIF